jgi:hypothetical protein
MSVQTPSARAIFERALELTTDADRQAYLDECCAGDPELRDKVEALLKAHAEAGSFLAQPAIESGETRDYNPIAERPGSIIGPTSCWSRSAKAVLAWCSWPSSIGPSVAKSR